MKILDFNKHRKLYIKHFDSMMSFESILEKPGVGLSNHEKNNKAEP
jgi:hypothetical protein